MALTKAWEQQLVMKASAAAYSEEAVAWQASADQLDVAYAVCAELTRQHSKTFYMASALLPAQQRRAMRALYAFCRTSDDLVDRAEGDALSTLQAWRRQALYPYWVVDDPVTLAWLDARRRFAIPRLYPEQLLEGVAQDLTQTRYATFAELAGYCYGVASTVGLMSMHITGFSGREALPYAIKLGVALQLTNILRDVAEDWRMGRLYLPQEDLQRFGVSEAAIAAGRNDGRWRALMRFEIERARRLYAESMPGIALLGAQGQLAVAAAAELYQRILDDIEAHNYDVFSRRAHLSNRRKAAHLPGIWWRVKRNRRDLTWLLEQPAFAGMGAPSSYAAD